MFLDAENSSLFVPGEDGNDERDASVRALRPRSSRRGSWGSEVSGWSAQILQTSRAPSQERGLSASNSARSNDATAENGRTGQETKTPTDEGVLADTTPLSSTYQSPDDSQHDASTDTSWDLTGAQFDLVNPDLSVRGCYRSTSLDTVGQSTTDKGLSITVSSVQVTEKTEKSTSA